MKLRCPSCGHAASILDFANEEAARQCVYLAADLPKPLGKLLMRYIGLFRPATRSLSWERTLKLMQQLKSDIDQGRIQYNGRIWPAPDGLWHKALNTMIKQADQQKLQLPLKNHNYLYTIISSEQNGVETRDEQKIEEKRQQAQHRKTVTNAEQPTEQSEQTKEIGGAVLAALRSNPKFKKRGDKS